MKVLVNKEVDINKWNDLLNRAEQSSPFQTPAYYEFFNSIDNLSASVHAIEHNDRFVALCVLTLQKEKGLKGYFSRRAITYGGPLFDKTIHEALYLLLSSIKSYYRNIAIYLEIRNFFDYSTFNNLFIENGWEYIPYLNFQLNLANLNKIKVLSSFKYNRRREIKQSLSNGATYAMSDGLDDLKGVYDILKELYKVRVKLPLHQFDFFLGLYKYNIIKVFVVKHNGTIIGGAICPFLPQKSIYTYYYCGIRDFDKKIFPTHLAILAAIEYSIDNNILMVDFMGAGKSDIEYGVRKYKAEFGGKLVEHGRYLKVLNPFLFYIGKVGLKLLKIFK